MNELCDVFYGTHSSNVSVMSSVSAPSCDAGGREFETPTGPTLRVFKEVLMNELCDVFYGTHSSNVSVMSSVSAPGCDAGGREFETPTGPTLRVFK